MHFDRTKLEEVLKPFLKNKGVIKASLFGSSVRNDYDDKSDIDLLIELNEDKSLLDLIALNIELEELLNHKVDLITYDSIHPKLKESILKEQKIIYEA